MQGFLSDGDFLDLLRLTQLCLIRGQIKPDEVPALRLRLADEYPTKEPRMNREIVRLLAYLGEPGANDRILEQLNGELPQEDKMHLALHARFIGQWTTNQKFELLSFFERARALPGGHSFVGYIENISRLFRRLERERADAGAARRGEVAALRRFRCWPSCRRASICRRWRRSASSTARWWGWNRPTRCAS